MVGRRGRRRRRRRRTASGISRVCRTRRWRARSVRRWRWAARSSTSNGGSHVDVADVGPAYDLWGIVVSSTTDCVAVGANTPGEVITYNGT